MSEGLNEVRLLGNLGADPELKMSQGGMAILKLRIATAARVKDKNETWVDKTEWHHVTVFGKRAEGLNKCLRKGSQVMVLGALRSSSYEDRDGQKRYKTEIIAYKILLCGGRPGGGGYQTPTAPNDQPKAADAPCPADDDLENLPF